MFLTTEATIIILSSFSQPWRLKLQTEMTDATFAIKSMKNLS